MLSKKQGVNLIGYFSHVSGVAEVSRFFATNLQAENIPFSLYNLETPHHQKLDEIELNKYKSFFSENLKYYKNIFFVNAEMIRPTWKEFPQLFEFRYNIGVFWWEFDDYFDFHKAFDFIKEVVVFSDFIAKAVKKAAPQTIKVTKLKFPFLQNWEISLSPKQIRSKYGIEVDDFVFIFNFDFYSVYDRKNPEAILQAFAKVFSSYKDVKLLLKTINGDKVPYKYNKFTNIIKEINLTSQVIVVDGSLSRNEMMSIINASDAYISLHRSEGLGLGMLEAMSMAKPVIATRYGGNLDFMNDGNSLLVNYELTPLKEDAPPYKKGWLWAEANIEEAANYMYRLYNDRLFTKQLGQKAQIYIQEHYNTDTFLRDFNEWMKAK